MWLLVQDFYNMVRVLVAFLIEVGKGKRNPDEVPQLLEEKIETMYLSLHPQKDSI